MHQIELEIQNEELQEAQINLEESRRKYFDFYNFVSDGYFTLNKEGIILEVNLASGNTIRHRNDKNSSIVHLSNILYRSLIETNFIIIVSM